jgi:hypothetical protein
MAQRSLVGIGNLGDDPDEVARYLARSGVASLGMTICQ